MGRLTLFTRAAIVAAALLAPAAAQAQPATEVQELLVPAGGPVETTARAAVRLSGVVPVVVRLTDPPLITANGPNSRRTGSRLTPEQQRAYVERLTQTQSAVMSQVAALGGREVGRVTKVYNALLVEIDAAQLSAVRAIAGVAAARIMPDFQLALSETVPYIGASALHAGGLTGTGVKVAVLDSGIDYTHRNLAGPGTTSAYAAAYGPNAAASENTTRDGLFPTAKVVEGYDFVGEAWPNGARVSDPDPIDAQGHGTHVADIIAGHSGDGTHQGVAPHATLLAVKVCSAVSTSCSGLATLLGMDFAVDPNGDSDLSDAADVINLSLGAAYGQREEDLTFACANAARAGIVVVAAAGNEADRPFIVGSPSVAPEVITVAQTQVPSAFGVPLIVNAPPAIAGTYANTALLSWAPVGAGFSNTELVFVGRGCPAGTVAGQPGEDPYLANPAGKVALIDRGICNVSAKVDRAAQAGAIGVLIGNNVAGDAVTFSLGGGSVFVPSLVITQATSNTLKAQLQASQTVLVTVSEVHKISMAGSMAGTSSRGPSVSYSTIKPDIGAPGASLSAIAGTGNGESAFSGTSGASPMVAGSAALLRQLYPTYATHEIKALLMNNAETNVLINPLTQPGVLAPITRIGAGEVRVDRAALAATAAWDAGDPASTSLSFGSSRLTAPATFRKKVLVRNYDFVSRVYNVSSSFRYADDAAGGAVTLSLPPSITVPANGAATFTMTLTADPARLTAWTLNGGSRGGDGFRLQTHEYDGYVTIGDASDTIRLPWHILLHKAANVTTSTTSLNLGGNPTGSFTLSNAGGAASGAESIFSLTGTSGKYPANLQPKPGDNFAIIDFKSVGIRYLPNGAGAGADVIQFAISTWGERAHPNYPAEFDIYIDVDMDGNDDYVVFNGEATGFGASGTNVTALVDLATNAQVVRFYTSADLDSSNAVLSVLRNDIAGLSAGTQFRFTAYAFDNYFTGNLTDVVGPMTYTLDAPRFLASSTGPTIPAGGSATIDVGANPAGDAASPSQLGLLVLHGDAKRGRESDAIAIVP